MALSNIVKINNELSVLDELLKNNSRFNTVTDKQDGDPPKKDKLNYDESTIKDVKDYLKRYYLSNFFKRNATANQSGWGLYPEDQVNPQEMYDAVNNTKLKITNEGESANDRSGNVNVNRTQNPRTDGSIVIAHELGHSNEDAALRAQPKNVFAMLNRNSLYDKRKNDIQIMKKDWIDREKNELVDVANTSKEANKYANINSKKGWSPVGDKINDINMKFSRKYQKFHDDSPNEIRADILALRYLAQKNKIWDPASNANEELTKEKFNQLMNLPELQDLKKDIKNVDRPDLDKAGFLKERLKERFDDNELMYLLKNIATNKTNRPGLYNIYNNNNV